MPQQHIARRAGNPAHGKIEVFGRPRNLETQFHRVAPLQNPLCIGTGKQARQKAVESNLSPETLQLNCLGFCILFQSRFKGSPQSRTRGIFCLLSHATSSSCAREANRTSLSRSAACFRVIFPLSLACRNASRSVSFGSDSSSHTSRIVRRALVTGTRNSVSCSGAGTFP